MLPDDDLELALRLARRAAAIRRARFGRPADVRTKSDGTRVGDADIEIEEALIAALRAERPGDAILSEEAGGAGPETSTRRWIIDPIDGTEAYLAGRDAWGTHIALEAGGELRLAVITRPTCDRMWWAVRGAGTYIAPIDDRAAPLVRLNVAAGRSDAPVRFGGLVEENSPIIAVLAARGAWIDERVSIIGALLEGRIDAIVDDAGKAWDQAPAVLLVQEAGGCFSDFEGAERFDRGKGLYCAPWLLDDLLAVLTPYFTAGTG